MGNKLITKRAADIEAEDVLAWLDTEPREDETLEFKADLPTKKGGRSPWNQGNADIEEYAKREIVAEVIAFANAFGGTLVVGIQEDAARRDIAVGTQPVRSCVELAKRFRSICKDLIEPVIPALEIFGVELEEDGSGVLVFRVPRSRSAPHRSTATKECYIRRSERSDRMTMREIQDLTLQVERGLVSIEKLFEERSAEFATYIEEAIGNQTYGYAVRYTAVPMVPIHLLETYSNDRVRAVERQHPAKFESGNETTVFFPGYSSDWRPVLRGVTSESAGGELHSRWILRQDGLVETTHSVTISRSDAREHVVFPTWIIGRFGDTLLTIDRVRSEAEKPEVEYGLEVEFFVRSEPGISVAGYGRLPRGFGTLRHGKLVFPRYSVQGLEDFSRLTTLFERDFWNAAGSHFEERIQVSFYEG